MKKEWILGIIAFILLIISIVLGIYVYNLSKTKDSNMLHSVQLAQIYNQNNSSNEAVSTSSTEERISPNCTIVEKQYYKDIIKTKPGLTGIWQVSGRNNATFQKRLKLEKEYSNNCSFKLDMKILFKTIIVVFKGDGAM